MCVTLSPFTQGAPHIFRVIIVIGVAIYKESIGAINNTTPVVEHEQHAETDC
jgi:hypothetical protein